MRVFLALAFLAAGAVLVWKGIRGLSFADVWAQIAPGGGK